MGQGFSSKRKWAGVQDGFFRLTNWIQRVFNWIREGTDFRKYYHTNFYLIVIHKEKHKPDFFKMRQRWTNFERLIHIVLHNNLINFMSTNYEIFKLYIKPLVHKPLVFVDWHLFKILTILWKYQLDSADAYQPVETILIRFWNIPDDFQENRSLEYSWYILGY